MSKLKESKAKRIFLKNLPLLILTLPGLIYVIMFNYVPMFGVVIAFKNYNYIDGIIGSEWVGLKYFKFFFESNDAAVVIKNSILYQSWFHIIVTVCAIGTALLLNNINSKRMLKTLLYFLGFGGLCRLCSI